MWMIEFSSLLHGRCSLLQASECGQCTIMTVRVMVAMENTLPFLFLCEARNMFPKMFSSRPQETAHPHMALHLSIACSLIFSEQKEAAEVHKLGH